MFKESRYAERIALGHFAIKHGTTLAAEASGYSRSTALYWKKKVLDPDFHAGSWGGAKSFKFCEEERDEIRTALRHGINQNNQLTLDEMTSNVSEITNLDINRNMIHRILKDEWNFTPKNPIPVQRAKFTIENILYYLQYIEWFSDQLASSFQNIKVLDICHFDGGKLKTGNKISSNQGDKNVALSNTTINENYSAIAVISTNPNQDPFFFNLIPKSNTQYDFAEFIFVAIRFEYLLPGDILIMNNETIHSCLDVLVDIQEVLQRFNIKVQLLPAYSPELSPIELVFNMIKNHICNNRTNTTLKEAILDGIATITTEKVQSCYEHVIDTFIEHPLNIPNNFM